MKGEFLLVKAFSVQEEYLDGLAGVGEGGLGEGGFVAGGLASSSLFLELGRATLLT